MLKMHIFLVGMAGAGKTSLGRRLATNLNIPFVDTEQRISEIMGMSVIEIFQTLGEQFFRNAEAGVLMELIGKPPCVVSTGGGKPARIRPGKPDARAASPIAASRLRKSTSPMTTSTARSARRKTPVTNSFKKYLSFTTGALAASLPGCRRAQRLSASLRARTGTPPAPARGPR